ncbi:MAG: 1-(5-phosphoribosyl)-5-[(5-phosphoribosylamino)methylideneamino]imidazole-4-carboxamide isomerase [SAR324 cluster bacterium]|nr:1-(5-phosphoribosyl)-5-[(5-phosphoribosylamino)methylideneamino]imidazole-4-carboxamide isomerase [SAR324 cluster bacterium]
MIIIPAIDLINGRCVRLLQGRAEHETVYSKDPVVMAKSFEDAGAKRIHIVDLDGAFKGQTRNWEVITKILGKINIPVEFGGGLRDFEDVDRVLGSGITSVIVGTMAVKKPQVLESLLQKFPGERIILGIDARNRKVAIEGWVEKTELDDVEFGLHWKQRGIQRVVYTDIARDGMMTGPNLSALQHFASQTGLRVTASGGVSSMADISQLKTLEASGVDHVIVGKAIYEGKIQLTEIATC